MNSGTVVVHNLPSAKPELGFVMASNMTSIVFRAPAVVELHPTAMKYLHSRLRIWLHSLVAATVVLSIQQDSLLAQSIARPYRLPAGVTPSQQVRELTVPDWSNSETYFGPVLGGPAVGANRAKNDYWIVSNNNNLADMRREKPRLEYYWCWDQANNNPGILPTDRLWKLNEASFTNWMDKSAPLCVVVFGACTNFDAIAKRAPAMSRWLRSESQGQPLNIVFFSWPSAKLLPRSDIVPIEPLLIPAGVFILDRRSEYQGLLIAEMLSQLPDQRQVCLIGHSYGGRAVLSTLHLMEGGKITNPITKENFRLRTRLYDEFRADKLNGQGRTIRVVLMAAAVDHHWLNPGQRYDGALSRIDRLLNLQNPNDLVLGLYSIRHPCATLAMGGPGLYWSDLSQLDVSQRAKIEQDDLSVLGDSLEQDDICLPIGTKHDVRCFYEHPDIQRKLKRYLFFRDAPVVARPSGSGNSAVDQTRQTRITPQGKPRPLRSSLTSTIVSKGEQTTPIRRPRFPEW